MVIAHARGFASSRVLGWAATLAPPLVALAVLYGPVSGALVRQWVTNDIYSHGFLVPGLSAYMVWMRRDQLARARIVAAPAWGVPILLAALAAFAIGQLGGMIVLQQASFVGVVAGGVLTLFGREVFRRVWLPVAYLLFMVPIWEILTSRVHLPFQLLSAEVGVSLLRLVGIPARQEAIYVDLPNVRLEVARVCSGVNYLIAIVAIGLPLAYFYLRGWGRRLVLLTGAVAVAVLGNGLRVALIGMLAYHGFAGETHGPGHVLQGLFVSAVGFLSLFGGVWLLAGPRRAARVPPTGEGQDAGAGDGWRDRRPPWSAVVLVSSLLLLASAVPIMDRPVPVAPAVPLAAIPLQLDGWRGLPAPEGAPNPFGRVHADHEVSRVYTAPGGQRVHLYVGYFETQTQGREIASFLTRGLERDARRMPVAVAPGHTLVVNEVVRRGDGRLVVLAFWYDVNGRQLVDGYLVKALTVWERLTQGRSNGAVVAVSFETRGDGGPIDFETPAMFIAALWPQLAEHLPKS